MTKAELIECVWNFGKKQGFSKTAINDLCDCVFQELTKGIKKDKRFTYPGFGTWTVKNRKARKGRNPQTGEEIKIKASRTVGFKPAPGFKNTL